MRRLLRSLGNKFEAIGYHAERRANRRREDDATYYARKMRWGILALPGVFGVFLPVDALLERQDARMLPAVPLGLGAIAMAVVALRARTGGRRFGRMMISLVLLALTLTVVGLAGTSWWPIPR